MNTGTDSADLVNPFLFSDFGDPDQLEVGSDIIILLAHILTKVYGCTETDM